MMGFEIPMMLFESGLCAVGISLISVVFYRLIMDPLARVPGPKLAAVTGCYEMYYGLVEKARFPWKIVELHEQYGKSIGDGQHFSCHHRRFVTEHC